MTASIEISDGLAQRLDDELVVWLTTVRSDATPQPSLVWFLWDNEEFLVFSEPGKAKLRNIAANPVVSLNLNSVGDGGVAVFTGEARLSREDDDPSTNQRYIDKYRSLIEGELASDGRGVRHRLPRRHQGEADCSPRLVTRLPCAVGRCGCRLPAPSCRGCACSVWTSQPRKLGWARLRHRSCVTAVSDGHLSRCRFSWAVCRLPSSVFRLLSHFDPLTPQRPLI